MSQLTAAQEADQKYTILGETGKTKNRGVHRRRRFVFDFGDGAGPVMVVDGGINVIKRGPTAKHKDAEIIKRKIAEWKVANANNTDYYCKSVLHDPNNRLLHKSFFRMNEFKCKRCYDAEKPIPAVRRTAPDGRPYLHMYQRAFNVMLAARKPLHCRKIAQLINSSSDGDTKVTHTQVASSLGRWLTSGGEPSIMRTKQATYSVKPEALPPLDTQLYCYCQKAMKPNDDTFMVGCDECDEWYHDICLGRSREELEALEKFMCDRCQGTAPYVPKKRRDGVAPQDLEAKRKTTQLTKGSSPRRKSPKVSAEEDSSSSIFDSVVESAHQEAEVADLLLSMFIDHE